MAALTANFCCFDSACVNVLPLVFPLQFSLDACSYNAFLLPNLRFKHAPGMVYFISGLTHFILKHN